MSTIPLLHGFTTPWSTLARLGGGQLIFGSASTSYYGFMALWYLEKGYKAWQVGMVFALMGVSDPLLMPLLAALLDKWRAHNIGISLLLLVAGSARLAMLAAQENIGFWAVATLDVFADPFLLLAFAVCEAMTVFALLNRNEFPSLKVCSNIGQAIAALSMGSLIGLYGTFDCIFYIHFGVCLLGAFYWFFAHRGIPSLKGDFAEENLNFLSVLKHAVSHLDCHAWLVFAGFVLLGVAFGAYQTFRLVILEELGAHARLLGLADTVASLSEIPVLMLASFIIRHIGTLPSIALSCTITSVRFLICGLISNPWHGLGSEALSGFTVALTYAAGVLYFTARVTEELKGSLLSFLGVVIFGVGFGLGALLAGLLADHMSLQTVFLYAGATCFTLALVFTLLSVSHPDPDVPEERGKLTCA